MACRKTEELGVFGSMVHLWKMLGKWYLLSAMLNLAIEAISRKSLGAVGGYVSVSYTHLAATDKFLFTGAEQGRAVDQEKLASDITEALKRKEFDAVIEASVKTVDPEFSEATAREKYKTIGSFSTKTTSNNKRNTNIKPVSYTHLNFI